MISANKGCAGLVIVTACVALLAAGGCGGSGGSGSPEPPDVVVPPEPDPDPVKVSLVAPATTDLSESEDPLVQLSVTADSAPQASVTVQLNYSGTVTRDHDYSTEADTVVIAAGTTSATFEIDVYRDFDEEDNETLSIEIGGFEGDAESGDTTRIDLNVLDGGGAVVDKAPERPDTGDGGGLSPADFRVTADSIEFSVLVENSPSEGAGTDRLIVEYSSERDFGTAVNQLDSVELPAHDPDVQVFSEPYEFSLPLSLLGPSETYFIRIYINDPPEGGATGGPPGGNVIYHGFSTAADGRVKTWCEPPVRSPDAGGSAPLFAEQWHLQNDGQSAFAANSGVSGADLRMSAAIDAGRDGDGVKLAILDSGLEICHPDLADNVEPGESFNFRFENAFGASMTDPFNFSALGDHGTSVAGVAAAVANNGFGGRGVASGVNLRAYNFGVGAGAATQLNLFNSLGGSSSNPDSAGADIFSMSFGAMGPARNSSPDFVNLVKMGVTELRSGRGALYVRGVGNSFRACAEVAHPLTEEVGCTGANGDPDRNLPYMINVGAFNASDVKSSYSNVGANLWVVAPAGEDGVQNPAMITTDQAGAKAGFDYRPGNPFTADHSLNPDGDYMSVFGGTSAATPAAAGAIAILLGVKPELTWRDVKHILADTSRRIDPDINRVRAAFNGTPFVLQSAWQTNAAGYSFHNWYGFGAVAIDDAVAMVESHIADSLGEFQESDWFQAAGLDAMPVEIPDNDGAGAVQTLEIAALPETANIEAVILEIGFDHDHGWELGFELTSPDGTVSVLKTPFNSVLRSQPATGDRMGGGGWRLLSNAFYGEQPNGTWTLRVVDLVENDTGSLSSWALRIYYGEHP